MWKGSLQTLCVATPSPFSSGKRHIQFPVFASRHTLDVESIMYMLYTLYYYHANSSMVCNCSALCLSSLNGIYFWEIMERQWICTEIMIRASAYPKLVTTGPHWQKT